jgi:hypothetical protein
MKKILMMFMLFSCTSAFALSLKEQKELMSWKESLSKNYSEGHAAQVVAKCGYEIPAELDEKLVAPYIGKGQCGYCPCDQAFEAIAKLCEDDMSKAAIKKSIKKLSCKLGKNGEAGFALNGTTLSVSYAYDAPYMVDKVKEYLENNLK